VTLVVTAIGPGLRVNGMGAGNRTVALNPEQSRVWNFSSASPVQSGPRLLVEGVAIQMLTYIVLQLQGPASASAAFFDTQTDMKVVYMRVRSNPGINRTRTLTLSQSGSKTSSHTRSIDKCWPRPTQWVAQLSLFELGVRTGFAVEFMDPPTLLTPNDWSGRYAPTLARYPVDVVLSDFSVTATLAENPFGFKVYIGNVTATARLVVLNASAFRLSVGAIPEYRAEADEQLTVTLDTPFFSSDAKCAPDRPLPIALITIIATPDPVAVAVQVAATVATATALSSGMAIGGATAAGDAQSLALLAMMSCAQPVEKAMTANRRLLSPLAIGNELEGMIVGNMILVVPIVLLQLVLVLVIKRVRKQAWLSVSSVVRFPAMTVMAALLTQQGTGAAALQLAFYRSNTDSIVLGVVASLYCLGLPLVLMAVTLRHVSASYHEYDYGSLVKDPAQLTAKKLWLYRLRWLLPCGRWGPAEVRKAYGPLFSGLDRSERLWTTQPTWAAMVMIIGSSIRPGSQAGCVQQFGWIASFQFLMVAVTLIFRPMRSIVANLLSALSSFCLGVVFSASATLADDPQSPRARSFITAAVQAR
jgi:hypothetical protein